MFGAIFIQIYHCSIAGTAVSSEMVKLRSRRGSVCPSNKNKKAAESD